MTKDDEFRKFAKSTAIQGDWWWSWVTSAIR